MIGWLSEWLRDIIAVILLAVLVELLLPNKAMQRYARLVVGLFILLTILSPVLRLLQTDISDRLDAGIQLWDEQSATEEIKMPGLEEIQKRAEEIQVQRNVEAAKLTARALEQSMREEITLETGLKVDSVDVELKLPEGSGKSNHAEITSVIVTLASRETAKERTSEEIEAVVPVDVQVNIENNPAKSADTKESKDQGNGYVQVNEPVADAIYGVLAKGFGVKAAQTVIWERAKEGAAY